jgi:hypothetical protein
MPYQVTERTCEILQDLHRLAAEQGRYLHLASSSAQLEWKEFQLRWPSEIELAQGTIALSEEHLEAITAKVRRFGEILRGLTVRYPARAKSRNVSQQAGRSYW